MPPSDSSRCDLRSTQPCIYELAGVPGQVDAIRPGVAPDGERGRSLPLATRNLQITTSRLDERAGVTGLALMLGDHIFAPHAIDHMLEKSGSMIG
jgi:hypothetical protein